MRTVYIVMRGERARGAHNTNVKPVDGYGSQDAARKRLAQESDKLPPNVGVWVTHWIEPVTIKGA